MKRIPDDIRACTHCGIQVSHFSTTGTDWTPWRHLAPCRKQCDPGGSETMGKDGGHSSMTECDDPKCPVVLATASKPERDEMIARLKRNGVTLIDTIHDGEPGTDQIEFKDIGGPKAEPPQRRRRMCFLDGIKIRLRDGTEIVQWYDGLEIEVGKGGEQDTADLSDADPWRAVSAHAEGIDNEILAMTMPDTVRQQIAFHMEELRGLVDRNRGAPIGTPLPDGLGPATEAEAERSNS